MRKKQSKKRALLPDPKFNDQLVTRFVNNLMLQGKKSTAYKVFYDAIDLVESKKEDDEKTSLDGRKFILVPLFFVLPTSLSFFEVLPLLKIARYSLPSL